ncbi:MAG: ABC transporter permease [Acidobacteria bacterium]|nr:ABC transporter permease [Acidobacteriota bacterium]
MLNQLLQLWRRLLFYLRRNQFDRELEEEMKFHLEMKARENLAVGMSAEEARYASQRQFGNQTLLREVSREMWGFRSLETLGQDIRYGLRMLVKHKGFTTVAVLTLALGIGANTAVFSLINALLLRALPVANPHELVVISPRGQGFKGGPASITFPMYRDMRARQEVFTDILATDTGANAFRLTIPDGTGTVELDNIQTSLVTANYWSVLGVQPALGRFFTEDEDRNPNSSETAGSLAVLSYSFWERQFGRDPAVLDRTVIVNRSPCRVIGVAARGFFGERVGREPDLWVPLVSFSPANLFENRFGAITSHLARLKSGVTLPQAQAAMTIIYQQLVQDERAQNPRLNPIRTIQDSYIQLEPGATGLGLGRLRQTFTQPLWIIMAIVALVLLIACANVANLLLARAVARQREISVRMALGCGRVRLMRQLLTESLLLSALGTVAGLLVAWWCRDVLLRMVDTGDVPLRLDLGPDARVLLFTAAVMVLTGIGFGLAPAWRASRVDLTSALKDQVRATGQRVRQYLGRTLVIIQVALSLLLLIGAGLLIRSLYNLRQIDLGFRPEQTLVFELSHRPRSNEPASLALVAHEVYERVKQIPGVGSASVSNKILLSPYGNTNSLKIHDYTPEPGEQMIARYISVSPDYFETVGMKLVDGRGIEQRDAMNAPLVAVVNESLARRYFPNGKAVGRLIGNPPNPIEIVGVVRDAKYKDLREEVTYQVYQPLWQSPATLTSLEVRTTEPLSAVAGPVRKVLLEVTRDVMIRRVVPLSDRVDQALASERLLTTICTFFGVLALLLASVGLYGVLSYAVAQRTQEIGIRRALGATDRNVLWLVLRQSLTVVLIGIALGLPLAILCTRLISSFLYGLSPTDPAAIALATLLLIIIALLACYLPARRATKIDPMIALRCE